MTQKQDRNCVTAYHCCEVVGLTFRNGALVCDYRLQQYSRRWCQSFTSKATTRCGRHGQQVKRTTDRWERPTRHSVLCSLYFELDLFETGSTTSLWASARDEEDRCLVQYQLTLKKPLRDRHAVVDGQTAKKRRVALEKGRKVRMNISDSVSCHDLQGSIYYVSCWKIR